MGDYNIKMPSILHNLNTLSIYTRIFKIANYVGYLTTRGLICTKMGSPYFKVDSMGHLWGSEKYATQLSI